MKAILSKLKAFVSGVYQVNAQENGDTPLISEEFLIQLQAHELAFYDEVDGLVCSKQGEERIQRTIFQYQQHCTLLIDKVYTQGLQHALTAEQGLLIRSLKEMLAYVRTHYPHYFSAEGMIPLTELKERLEHLRQQHLVFIASLRKRKVNPVIEKVFTVFFNRQLLRQKVSYRELEYLEKLQTSLINFLYQVSNSPVERLLVGHLIYLNFNHRSFIACVAELMQSEAALKQNDKEQYRFWCALERDLNSFEEINLTGLYPASLSARMQLLNFVNAEIVYYHRGADVVPVRAAIPAVAEDNFRVKIAISTAALAYLIRLFIETAIIEANPRSALLRFICRHVETAGIGEELLSVNSLGTKYKQVVQSTAVVVHRLLKRMVRAVEVQFPGVG